MVDPAVGDDDDVYGPLDNSPAFDLVRAVKDRVTAAATDERHLLRLIARHGTPTDHLLDGHPCRCWSDAKQVLRDLHGAGYLIVKEFNRA